MLICFGVEVGQSGRYNRSGLLSSRLLLMRNIRRCRLRRSSRWSCGRWWWVQLGVLTLAVPPQVDFALESAAAVVASKRLVTSMLPRVGDQVGRLAESLTTDRAFVRLLTCKLKKKSMLINAVLEIA